MGQHSQAGIRLLDRERLSGIEINKVLSASDSRKLQALTNNFDIALKGAGRDRTKFRYTGHEFILTPNETFAKLGVLQRI
jgi:hypothetical protein